MAVPLSPNAQAFLREKVFAHIATVMQDGSPHSTIVWVDTDGTSVLINTSIDRLKLRNMKRDARVALSIAAPENAYRCMYVRGRVTSISEEGGIDHIDAMARKYRGEERYPREQLVGVTRVKVAIEPLYIVERGLDRG